MKESIKHFWEQFSENESLENRLRHLQEELAELIVSVSHVLRQRASLQDLASEIADVEILLFQTKCKVKTLDMNVQEQIQYKTDLMQNKIK